MFVIQIPTVLPPNRIGVKFHLVRLFFQVYHEADTFGFVKYVNSIFPHEEFHDIALTYVEQSTTDE